MSSHPFTFAGCRRVGASTGTSLAMGRPRRVIRTLCPAWATWPISSESRAFACATVVVFTVKTQQVKMTHWAPARKQSQIWRTEEGFGFRPAPSPRAETQGAQTNTMRARSNPSLFTHEKSPTRVPLRHSGWGLGGAGSLQRIPLSIQSRVAQQQETKAASIVAQQHASPFHVEAHAALGLNLRTGRHGHPWPCTPGDPPGYP